MDAERLGMEIVEAFEACTLDTALQPKRSPGKSGKVAGPTVREVFAGRR
jgi:hypothetical protein